MSFVEFPRFNNWDIMAIKFIGGIVKGLNAPQQYRGIANIKLISFFPKYSSSLDGFLNAYGC